MKQQRFSGNGIGQIGRFAPWAHQIEALAFIERRFAGGAGGAGGALLSMSMGTGKSLVAIHEMIRRDHKRILVLAPKNAALRVWPQELRKHAGDVFDVCVPRIGRVDDRATEAWLAATAADKPFVLVLNYEAAWRYPFGPELKDPAQSYHIRNVTDQGILAALNFDLVIFDEAHRIKSPTGRAAKFCHWLGGQIPYRLGLTGTIMAHSPLDVWSPALAIAPEIFGHNFWAFRNRYAEMGGYEGHQVIGYKNAREMNERLSRFSFTVGKEVLDLPPFHHLTRSFSLSAAGKRVYREMEAELVAEIEDGTVTAFNALTRTLRLQQITSGYLRDDEGIDHAVDGAKEAELRDVLEDIDAREPVVVFCKFKWDLDAVHRVAQALDRVSLELSGRRDELEQWADGAAPIIAVQIQAGGVGIDLTRAATVIYYSATYSLSDFDQSLARVHRPGQERPVSYIHLVAEATIDEVIYAALQERRDVAEAILQFHRGKRHNKVRGAA